MIHLKLRDLKFDREQSENSLDEMLAYLKNLILQEINRNSDPEYEYFILESNLIFGNKSEIIEYEIKQKIIKSLGL